MPISVMIVDDIPEITAHFSFILQNEKDINVVGIASGGKEAVKMALELKPDVILIDIQMETDDAGLIASKQILEKLPETKIIILTIHNDSQNITEAYMIGAVDYLVKTSSVLEIINAIYDSVKRTNFANNVNRTILDEMLKLKKTQKEMITCFQLLSKLNSSDLEIIQLLCEGKRYKEIAKERFVEEVTIRSKINKISKKINGMPIRDLVTMLNSCRFFDIVVNHDE